MKTLDRSSTDLQNVSDSQDENIPRFNGKINILSTHDSQSIQLMNSQSQTYQLDLISDMNTVSYPQQHSNTEDYNEIQENTNNEAFRKKIHFKYFYIQYDWL